MVVQAAWPGATVEDTLQPVTERLARKLQETPRLDFLRGYTTAGVTTSFIHLNGNATGREFPDIWYHVRNRELRDCVEDGVPDISKIEIPGAQDEKIFVELSMKELANLGIDRAALIAALQAQNVVQPAGTVQTGSETLALRISGAFQSEQDVLATNFVVGSRMLRLGDIAEVRRSFAAQPLLRINGKPGIGVAIAMRDGWTRILSARSR